MSQIYHQHSAPLEVMIMFEPHRLQQHFLQDAYASVVPVSCRRLSIVHQRVGVPENRDRSLVRAKKGARNA